MTHSFLLKGDEQPVCIPCDEPLTVEHILLSCADLIEVLKNFFYCNVFEGTAPERFSERCLRILKRKMFLANYNLLVSMIIVLIENV